MDDRFKIYPDQLRNGNVEEINELYEPDFISINEKELKFVKPVSVKGQAYLADDNLVLNLDIEAFAVMPCSICNEAVEICIDIESLYHVEPLEQIKGAVYNLKELLREAIVIDVPNFAECHNGHCPQRKEMAKYFKKDDVDATKKEASDGDRYHPFADIDL